MAEAVGAEVAGTLQSMSLEVYEKAAEHASKCGLILADTKFEWGFDERTGELLLVDEVLTPDSSRYWAWNDYHPGGPQPSFDKQFVRDWLETTGWDKASPPPELPEEVVARTRAKYVEAYRTPDRPGVPLRVNEEGVMLRYLTAGESHGPALTAIVEGFPSGVVLDTGADQPRAGASPGGLRPRQAAEARDRPHHRRLGGVPRRHDRRRRSPSG